jgi:hypothetical protein
MEPTPVGQVSPSAARAAATAEHAVRAGASRLERIIPNPKLKLMDQVREVMRLKHYALRTERCYCDWVRRYVRFLDMKSRTNLESGEAKSRDNAELVAVLFSSTLRTRSPRKSNSH